MAVVGIGWVAGVGMKDWLSNGSSKAGMVVIVLIGGSCHCCTYLHALAIA